jgi:hypothetical protein
MVRGRRPAGRVRKSSTLKAADVFHSPLTNLVQHKNDTLVRAAREEHALHILRAAAKRITSIKNLQWIESKGWRQRFSR